tara:strand:+ start:133260 stop:134426 length:1167 start_codon:yes stop_codon:yes gene_type:complete
VSKRINYLAYIKMSKQFPSMKNEPKPAPVKKRRTGLIIGIVVASLLIITAIVVIIIVVWLRNRSNNSTADGSGTACTLSSDCAGDTVCKTSTGLCVDCVTNSQCTGTEGVCRLSTNTCVECLDNTECTGLDTCNTNTNACVTPECVATADLTPPTIVTGGPGIGAGIWERAFEGTYTTTQTLTPSFRMKLRLTGAGTTIYESELLAADGTYKVTTSEAGMEFYETFDFEISILLVTECGTTLYSTPYTVVIPTSCTTALSSFGECSDIFEPNNIIGQASTIPVGGTIISLAVIGFNTPSMALRSTGIVLSKTWPFNPITATITHRNLPVESSVPFFGVTDVSIFRFNVAVTGAVSGDRWYYMVWSEGTAANGAEPSGLGGQTQSYIFP